MARVRSVEVRFRVTPEERDMLSYKVAQSGMSSTAAYLRKMALDGMIIVLDLPEIRALTSTLSRYGSNLNQITKRVNSTGRVYDEDISEIRDQQTTIMNMVAEILRSLSKIKLSSSVSLIGFEKSDTL